MNKNPLLLIAVCAALAAAPVSAAAPSKRSPAKTSSFSALLQRISNYLNAEPVRKAPRVAAVAAVRGGIPTDQGENLDQETLDRAALLRQSLLAAPSPADSKRLMDIYRSLAFSQWVQAAELNGRPQVSEELSASLKEWAATKPALPSSLKALLSGPTAGLNDKSLVAAGWGAYCRDLTPAFSGDPHATPGRMASPDTARLDETLKSLQSSWSTKSLAKQDEAEAHFLAGQVYAQLTRADFAGVDEPAAASPRPVPAQAMEPAAPVVAAPAESEDSGAPAPEFNARSIYAKASPAVVLILCADKDGSGELGSGSLLDASGRILTNAHVVIRDSTRKPWPTVRVYFKPAKMTGDPQQDLVDPSEAEVVQWDSALDLALIQVKKLPSRPAILRLGDPADVVVGDRVATIGHPEQGGLWTLTTGVVSTYIASLGNVPGKKGFQTDASINRGNSGGPLVDASGNIIGVNTLMSRKAADGLAITGVNYAVRADVAKRWLADKAGLKVAYGPSAAPAMVASNTPAAKGPSSLEGRRSPSPEGAARAPAALPPAAPPAAVAQNVPPAATPMTAIPSLPMSDSSGRVAPPPTMRPGVTQVGRVGREVAPKALPPAPQAQPVQDWEPKRQTITESRPYDRDSLIEAEIKEMEDLEKDMHDEFMKRKPN